MGKKETGTDVPGNSLKEGITLSTSGPLLSEREVRTDGTKEQRTRGGAEPIAASFIPFLDRSRIRSMPFPVSEVPAAGEASARALAALNPEPLLQQIWKILREAYGSRGAACTPGDVKKQHGASCFSSLPPGNLSLSVWPLRKACWSWNHSLRQ